MSLSIVSKIKSKIFGHNNHLFIVVIPFYNAENWIEKRKKLTDELTVNGKRALKNIPEGATKPLPLI